MNTKLTALLLLLLTLTACSGKKVTVARQDTIDPAASKTIAPINYKGRKIASGGDIIPGQFIVTLAADANADDVIRTHGLKPIFVYRHSINGFAASMSDVARAGLAENHSVVTIEPDQKVYANAGTQNGAVWGIDRTDQRTLPLSGSYSYLFTGSGVTAYVIDTGIRYDHAEFGGRATAGFDAFGGTGADCNGHGTHVSGTIGGATYGVAKDVNLVAVRVLDCNGSGSTSGVIAGVDWVAANHSGPSVANLSLGGGASYALDLAVHKMIESGVVTAVAAGNDNRDACNYSPARTTNAITVGASTSTDARASYSNYGKCVDFFAPGSSITSSWYTASNATNTISGTSMATPHVAGVAALYLESHPSANAIEVRDALLTFTSKAAVTSANSANNHLLYSYENAAGSGDYTSPATSIASPAAGAVLPKRTNVTLQSTSTDNVAVSKTEFYGNGSLLCSSTAAPFQCTWKTPPTAGNITLQSRAYDAGGNATASQPVLVSIK